MQIDGRQRREHNRKARGSHHYENMLARYEKESKLTAHYFIDLETGEIIRDCIGKEATENEG